ncbi:hypothetical protein [Vibrio crassostreae]|uniref:hypothetical protein n=1 Tax=Vibrio crassostreae TaxID=246167 RepID=UPI001B3069AA|nr:hypothetical protein [Vibrio crassostreae]
MSISITESTTKTITINGESVDDPITLFVNDIDKGKGSVTIKCYDSAWTAYWGGMGDRTVLEYLATAQQYSLVNYLASQPTEVVCNDSLIKAMTDVIEGQFESGFISELDRDLALEDIEGYEYECHADSDPCEWLEPEWHYELPMKPSREWTWLEKIVETIQKALNDQKFD